MPRVGTCECATPANSRIFAYNSASHSSPSPHVYTLANNDDGDRETQVSGSKDSNSTTGGKSNAVQKASGATQAASGAACCSHAAAGGSHSLAQTGQNP